MDLQNRISLLLGKLKGFPKKDERDILELLEHEEWGVALEVICSVIEQESISIDAELYNEIEKIGFYMEIDDDLWTVLKPVN